MKPTRLDIARMKRAAQRPRWTEDEKVFLRFGFPPNEIQEAGPAFLATNAPLLRSWQAEIDAAFERRDAH